jgi:hypothetical protein
MKIKGKTLEELKEITLLQIEDYKEEIKSIDINHPVQYWENECKVDDLNQKIEVLEAFVELIDLKNQENEN